MSKIFVGNQAQRILVECELKGQLSDGMWENAVPHNHWRKPCTAEVIVALPGQPTGVTWFGTKKRYNFTDKLLLECVGKRMIAFVKFYAAFPDLAADFSDHWTFDLSDGWPTAEGDYWDKKRSEILAKTKLSSYEEIKARIDAVSYTEAALLNDLKQLKRVFTTSVVEQKDPQPVKPVEPRMNKVWIELEKPTSKEHAELQCKLVNSMLKRLCKPEDWQEGNPPRMFFYSEHERRYCYGGAMGYTVLTDNGEWFNLDYFGRED